MQFSYTNSYVLAATMRLRSTNIRTRGENGTKLFAFLFASLHLSITTSNILLVRTHHQMKIFVAFCKRWVALFWLPWTRWERVHRNTTSCHSHLNQSTNHLRAQLCSKRIREQTMGYCVATQCLKTVATGSSVNKNHFTSQIGLRFA